MIPVTVAPVVAPVFAAPVAVSVTAPTQSSASHVVPPAELKLDWANGLTQIETDLSKAQAMHRPAAAAAGSPHARRVRPAALPVSSEPLMQVETQRNDTLSHSA